MNKLITIILIILSFYASSASAAGHEEHNHDFNIKESKYSGSAAHEEIVNGIKATFKVEIMADAMKSMGMEMPEGIEESHHVSVEFRGVKSRRLITSGEVKVKVQSPDKNVQVRQMMAMHGHFGADFIMKAKGKYGVMCKFKVKDGKVRQAQFWYTVK